jgi:MFS transporter, ACS family, allantoate permease
MSYAKTPIKMRPVSPHAPPGDDVAGGEIFNIDDDTRAEAITQAQARWVLWKIDLIILPLISGSVILSAVDKVIISNAAIYGMEADDHLSSGTFSWVGSIFYFGYLIFEYPSAILIQRLPVAKLLASTVMLWAILMCCTAATHNFAGLMVVRFIMGMTEAAVFPICSILTVMWYRRDEQPIRVAFWYNQVSLRASLLAIELC